MKIKDNQQIADNMYHYLSAWNLSESVKTSVTGFLKFALTHTKEVENQDWFWSDAWQKGEEQASLDIKNKKLSPKFKDAQSLIKYLN
jgi:hypothetical protein